MDDERLHAAARRAATLRVSAALSLVRSGGLSESAYIAALARHMGLRVLEREPAVARWHNGPNGSAPGFARLRESRRTECWVIAPRLDHIDGLLENWQRPGAADARLFLASASTFEAWYLAANGGTCAEAAATHLHRLDPALSALDRPRPSVRGLAIVLGPLAVLLWLAGLEGLRVALGIIAGLLFGSASLFRILAASASEERAPAPSAPLSDADLPTYTVLVPLLREAAVLPQLLAALVTLDYPREKLDIRLLVEADDRETREGLEALALPATIRVMQVPPGVPRGKPRALQIALPFARGELLTVFDAEDVPEPDQLRRAAAAFARAPANVGCLQASLVIDNAGDGWLTSTFALEYAALFDAVNPGLDALDWPIFLGGTSNHFRTKILREVGGWDPWNVTEDADLGLRLRRFGYRVATLPSATDEEAPGRLTSWLGQRRRWLKGWMQTLLTHGRSPRSVLESLGPVRTLAAASTLLGGLLGPLLGPVYLCATALDMVDGRLFAPVGAGQIMANTLSCFVLIVGPVALLWPMWLGMRRRRPPHAWRSFASLPAYLALTSVAAWLALWELWRAPYHWRKTGHGFARTSLRRASGDDRDQASHKPSSARVPGKVRPRIPSPRPRSGPPLWLFRKP